MSTEDIWDVVHEEYRPSGSGWEAAPPFLAPVDLLASLSQVTSSTPPEKVKDLVRAALESANVVVVDELSGVQHPQFIVGEAPEEVVSIVASAVLVNAGGAPVDDMNRIERAPSMYDFDSPQTLRVPFIITQVNGARVGPMRRHMGIFKLAKSDSMGDCMDGMSGIGRKMIGSLFIQAW